MQDAERLKVSAPKFGFGTSQREGRSQKTLNVPGPGNYRTTSFTGADMPKYSMGAVSTYSPEKKEQNSKPGPGNYTPEPSRLAKQAPSYGMGSSTRVDLQFEKAKTF